MVIAAYDVSEDARRARLGALLQSVGDRIQFSVFLLTVADDELADVLRRAGDIIDAETDSLYFFRQCATCWGAVDCQGQAHPPAEEILWLAL